MAVKAKFSQSYRAKQLRIKKIPSFANDMVEGIVRRDLIQIKKMFHDGIKNDTLRLDRLATLTKKSKRKKGFPRPAAPLHGKGDGEKERSYMNMLNIEKRGKSWKLVPSRRKHWSGKITLKELFTIHEHGAKIKRGDIIIEIPPRPALLLSYRRWLIKRRQQDSAREVRQALTLFINTGSKALIKNLQDWKDREK